jgi:phospholipase D
MLLDPRKRLSVASVCAIVCLLLAVGSPVTCASDSDADAEVTVAFTKDCERSLVEAVNSARKQVLVAAHKRDVRVQVKLDRTQAKGEYSERIVKRLRGAGVSVLTIGMPEDYHMHHKFVVIDDDLVLTGSYNFTVSASTVNYENLVAVKSEAVARRFLAEYERIKTRKQNP